MDIGVLLLVAICTQVFGMDDAMSIMPEKDVNKSESIKMRDVESFEVTEDKPKSSKVTEISCESGKCVISSADNNKSINNQKIATDVHVKVITDLGNKSGNKRTDSIDDEDEDDDVPVIKGMNGVAPEDVNSEEDKDKDQASEILTVPGSDDLIIINEKPSDSPKKSKPAFNPPSWHKPSWRRKPSFYPDSNEIHKRRGCKPEEEVEFHAYNIGKPPPGWSTPWKPSYPRFPEDRYHYKSNAPNPDGYDVQFVTECSCTRTPVYRPKPFHPPSKPFYPPSKPSYPWYPIETTTVKLDGKLLPPFNRQQRRQT